ncbi:MAG: Rrf2 family transcriptional regulator [Spirochaetales bacterium]|nr:Rrf2 family transcriptional regulator [Spirochaetales bacterium]RKX83755.1 MAG: AsnC family transcriptional regulator [Spirochaetota bacterium]
MRLTTKGRYGVRAIFNLASSYQNRPVSIKKISKEEQISPEFLEQIFFKLKKAGIIRSLRGPGGGFVLNKKASEISIKDILDAVGENVFPVPCTDRDAEERCEREDICSLTDVWKQFADIIIEFLSNLTLQDILDKNGKKYYDSLKEGQDFTI